MRRTPLSDDETIGQVTKVSGFEGAEWIARAVPAEQRILREIRRSRIDWAEPGHTLAQGFNVEGPFTAINLDIAGPRDAADPYTADVKFVVTVRSSNGSVVLETVIEGPHIVWDSFGTLLELQSPAPAGEYFIELRADRETIGWHTAQPREPEPDDGVSPLQVPGAAFADGEAAEGVRLIGVETVPAPNPLFRRRFSLEAVPLSATLSATVLGTGIIRFNGIRVGDPAIEPAVTDYDKSVLFRTWDIAHLLRAGENEILIEAGRERFAARGGDVWGWSLAPWHREPMALARLEMVDAAGATTSISTGVGWETAPGPVEADQLFLGEHWVIRAEEPGWEPVTVVQPPSGELRYADIAPVRALAPKPPVTIERLSDGSAVYDFGEVMVGRVRARVTGAAGSVVTVVSGEQRGATGEVICDNQLVAGDAQVDVLRLATAVDGYVFEPSFGYRGFRWMQVAVTGDATVDQVRAVPLYTQVDHVGDLTASDPVLEWINTAFGRTFRNNLHGIPTDTPIYEKNGWTADAHLATEGLLHHYDLRDAFGKWMHDHRDSQRADGSIPHIIPTPGWGLTSDPTWSASAVLIPWYLYREYGDLAILADNADMIRRFADNLTAMLGDGLWRHRTWGDWLAPGYHVPPEGMPPIGTIMCVSVFQHAARVLRELGDSEAARYEQLAAEIGDRYHAAYFTASASRYAVDGVGYRQALNILPLAFGTVPDEHLGAVRASLIDDLEHRTDGHLDCGAVGVRHLLPVLSEAGRDDLALTVLTQRTRPSWGVWFDEGESTLLESWDVDARSRNHYFLGSVAAWIQQRVGGMRLTEPGWRKFEVAPVDDPRIHTASIRHRTLLGDAAVHWERGPGGWRFDVTVPPGAVASIRVPHGTRELTPGRHVVHIPN
jgi:alpha-L-rhamnosidase